MKKVNTLTEVKCLKLLTSTGNIVMVIKYEYNQTNALYLKINSTCVVWL